MQIIMRHGNDNKKSKYKQDNSLNLEKSINISDIIKITQQLIYTYGYPDKIYCSPFYRTIQTAKIMQSQFNKKIKIYIDPKLSRFFTQKEQLNPSIRKKTFDYNPPIYEDKNNFYNRIDKLNEKLVHRKKNYWYITHYLVIKRLAFHHNVTIPTHMPFLYVMPIK